MCYLYFCSCQLFAMSVVYSYKTDLIGSVPLALAKILKGNRVTGARKHFKNNTSIQISPQIVAAYRLLDNRGNKENTQGNRINTRRLE